MMPNSEHLMNQNDFARFFQEMWLELEKHKDEKTGIKNWPLDQVWKLSVDEIEERLHKIRTQSPDVIHKQCLHIANYCYFLWCKTEQGKCSP